MKEVLAIIRRERVDATKEALLKAGFPSMHLCNVEGKGRQRGLKYAEKTGDGAEDAPGIKFLPKKMLTIMVRDEDLDEVIDAIIKANQTREIGDGKIFVSPLNDSMRIRTGELGEKAL
jgi:nitrogen regulatory protein PII 2